MCLCPMLVLVFSPVPKLHFKDRCFGWSLDLLLSLLVTYQSLVFYCHSVVDSFMIHPFRWSEKDPTLGSLEGAKERLHLFKADLLEEGSFDSAIDGCEGVFHTASPFCYDVKDPQILLFIPSSSCFHFFVDCEWSL